jgi:hypothetical protein
MCWHPPKLLARDQAGAIPNCISYLGCIKKKIGKNTGANSLITKTHSEVAGNYHGVPEDPRYYVETSKMAQTPEVTLWDFMEKRPDKEYEKFCLETGADTTTQYNAVPLNKIDVDEPAFWQFMKDNEHTCQKKYYEERPYHSGINEFTLELPLKCGFNHRNTCEYNWGLYGDSNEQLKELIGGRQVFEEQIKMDYDSVLCRLLAYLPGQCLPLHYDYLGGWARENAHLNPDMENKICDIGPVRRYLVMLSDWHWGHAIQIANNWFPNWKQGEIYDLPMGMYHASSNFGIRLKLTLSLSGVILE